MELSMDTGKKFATNCYSNEFLGVVYRTMIPHNICFIVDQKGHGASKYIDLAPFVFKGMDEEVKEQYVGILNTIMKKKNISVDDINFWQTIHCVNPSAVNQNLGNEIAGVFTIISKVVGEAQKVRSEQGQDWFSITEEEIKKYMGIENFDEILDAVYSPRTEIVQKYFDEVTNSKLYDGFGTQPLIKKETSIKK